MKNSNDTIGIRTRDLPVCSAVSQPTAAHLSIIIIIISSSISSSSGGCTSSSCNSISKSEKKTFILQLFHTEACL
jgi:hypothetical protein